MLIDKYSFLMHAPFSFPSSWFFLLLFQESEYTIHILFCWLKLLCRPAAFQEGLLYKKNMPTKLYIKQKNVTIYMYINDYNIL